MITSAMYDDDLMFINLSLEYDQIASIGIKYKFILAITCGNGNIMFNIINIAAKLSVLS